MGGRNIATVVQRLLEAGRPAATPVAVVREAALPTQREWRGSLGNIVVDTQGEALSPCIIIVGEVSAM
jgi:uroporphyrinogen III methyltransferase/synthase